jgi:hypothetical protein
MIRWGRSDSVWHVWVGIGGGGESTFLRNVWADLLSCMLWATSTSSAELLRRRRLCFVKWESGCGRGVSRTREDGDVACWRCDIGVSLQRMRIVTESEGVSVAAVPQTLEADSYRVWTRSAQASLDCYGVGSERLEVSLPTCKQLTRVFHELSCVRNVIGSIL